jgi:hypothetical protein
VDPTTGGEDAAPATEGEEAPPTAVDLKAGGRLHFVAVAPTEAAFARYSSLCVVAVGLMAHRGGIEYETSFRFLKQQINLKLSTSVSHLKEFFSTAKAH